MSDEGLAPELGIVRRRRATERASVVARTAGVLFMIIATVFHSSLPSIVSPGDVWKAYTPLLGIAMVSCALSYGALRTCATPRYRTFNIAQVASDATAVLVAVVALDDHGQGAVALLLTLPVIWAGIRLGLPGALLTWAATLVAYPLVTVLVAKVCDAPLSPGDVSSLMTGVLLHAVFGFMTGWLIGKQTQAMNLHVRALEDAREILRHQATHDALTGLGNRTLLYRQAAMLTPPGALLAIDLDGFKAVNDSLGHAAGDALLQQSAARLRRCTGPDDTVIRMGGDEFVVLLPGADRERTERLAADLKTALSAPAAVANQIVTIGASIGISAVTEGTGWDLDALIAEADSHMYAIKAATKVAAATLEGRPAPVR